MRLACLLAGLLACACAQATTWYVRTDGGTARQCTGRVDAPYPGHGKAQACAWKHPSQALPGHGRARIAGGDTLVVGAGSYAVGPDSHLGAVPDGRDAAHRTRILGTGHGAGCLAPPQLWGRGGVEAVLDLHGSEHVEIGCLELTDHSDCVVGHSNDDARCPDAGADADWAAVGIAASDSTDVHLHDLDIHGLANAGLLVGGLRDWTLERVRINANGWAGWNGDIGEGSSNAGDIVLRDVEIAWNGCGQRWRSGEIWACWAQQAGGYGDGLGTAETGGRWLIEDSRIHHNTSDGLDLLYLDGEPGTSVTIRRVYAAGNAGNQLKTRGETLIEDSVVVGNCAFFDGRFDMTGDDQCRARGNAVSVTLVGGQDAVLRHNTLTGEGDCLILTAGGEAGAEVLIENNALVGQRDYTADGIQMSCAHYAEASPARVRYRGNAFWNLKDPPCGNGNSCGRNPRLRDMSLAHFDARPLPDSPLLDTGVPRAEAGDMRRTDFLGQPRAASGAIGAIAAPTSGTSGHDRDASR